MDQRPKTKDQRPKTKDPLYFIMKTLIYISITFILVGGLIYSNTFNNGFVFDDLNFIENNLKTADLSSPGGWIKASTWDRPARAVGFFTFALNYYMHGDRVFGYHLVNWIIHLVNGILVWRLVALLFATPVLKDKETAEKKELIAFFSGLVFLAHPVQTEAVTYVYQRLASLAALFYLAAVCLYLTARIKQGQGRPARFYFAGAAVSFILGVLTKENAVTLPFAVMACEWIFFRGAGGQPAKRDKVWRYIYVLLALMIFVPLFIYKFDLNQAFHTLRLRARHHYTLTSWSYFVTQPRVIITYIRLLFLPVRQNLDYDYPVSRSLLEPPAFISLVFLSGLIILVFRLVRKQPLVSFAVLWFFITISVESSIIPLRYVIFEHRLYLPAAGFAVLVSSAVVKFFKNGRVGGAVLCSAVVVLAVLTYQRNNVWRDGVTLWSDVVSKSPGKPYGYMALGRAYQDKGDNADALKAYQEGLALYDFDQEYIDKVFLAETLNNMGIIYYLNGDDMGALKAFRFAAAYRPGYAKALNNYGRLLYELGRYENAKEVLSEAVKYQRRYPYTYYYLGLACEKTGDEEGARAYLKKAAVLFDKDNNVK